jgi:sulfur dioxygenase
VQITDVREPSEFAGPLGRIRGTRLIPPGDLAQRLGEIEHDRPIVTVCRPGGRSAQATIILGRAGFTNIVNLAGRLLRWRAEGHAVVGGAS